MPTCLPPRWRGSPLAPWWLASALTGLLPCATAAAHPLAEALNQAWLRDPQAAALQDSLAQTRAALEQAASLTPGPVAASVSQLNDRLQQNLGRREWELELATPLWWPGQRQAQLDLARLSAEELDTRTQARRFQLAGELREAWWALAHARQAQALAEQRLASARSLAELVQRRYRTGDLARLDANAAELEQLAAESEFADSQAATVQAEQRFAGLAAMAAPAVLAAEGHRPSGEQRPAPALEPAEHPLLQALQSSVALARGRLALLDAAHPNAPELALRWTQQRADAFSRPDQALGLKLTIPLGDAPQRRQDSAAARAALAQADAELTQGRLQVQQARQQADDEHALAERQAKAAGRRLQLARDSLQLTEKAFALGEIDLASLLRARATAHEAQAASARQELALQTALSRQLQAQGLWP